MKVSNPLSRYKLKISNSAKVLDVGSGHNPHPRANVLTDKFVDSNFHRLSDIKVLKNQRFVEADGQSLPFKDKEFDFVICCHVAEHAEDPAKFLDELSRVGNAGYLEVPSLLGEFLNPKNSHKWVVLEIDNKLIFFERNKLGFSLDFGSVFMKLLPKISIGYKILQRTHPVLLTINYEWKGKIDYLISPTDDVLIKYFTEPWDEQKFNRIFKPQSFFSEVLSVFRAIFDMLISLIKTKLGIKK